jgi:tetratricopeptide (TPR) repeat protein
MAKSETSISVLQDSFREVRHRYVDYFWKIARASDKLPKEEVEAELPNLSNAFYMVLGEKDARVAHKFWEAMGDFFWYRCYWHFYSDWGENTLRLLQETGSNRLAEGWLMSELGWLHMEWGDFISAEELFFKAKDLFCAEEDQRGICIIERYIGVLAYRKNDLDTASKQYKAAEQIARANNYELILSEIYNLQGSLESTKGNKERAFELYTESKKLVEKLGDKWRLTATLRNLAQLEAELGHYEAAKTGFEQIIELCLQADRKDMLYSCQIKLAKIERKLGNLIRAKELALAARDGYTYLGMKRDLEEVDEFLSSITVKNQ